MSLTVFGLIGGQNNHKLQKYIKKKKSNMKSSTVLLIIENNLQFLKKICKCRNSGAPSEITTLVSVPAFAHIQVYKSQKILVQSAKERSKNNLETRIEQCRLIQYIKCIVMEAKQRMFVLYLFIIMRSDVCDFTYIFVFS